MIVTSSVNDYSLPLLLITKILPQVYTRIFSTNCIAISACACRFSVGQFASGLKGSVFELYLTRIMSVRSGPKGVNFLKSDLLSQKTYAILQFYVSDFISFVTVVFLYILTSVQVIFVVDTVVSVQVILSTTNIT